MIDDYEFLATRLLAMGLMSTAAEVHGMVCGQLCGGRGDYSAALTARIMGLQEAEPELVTLLNDLAIKGREQFFEAEGFSFSPLLPEDDEDIGLRLYALGRWCEGFTLGYAAACSAGGAALPEEAREVLADFARIAEADSPEGDDDSEEVDYMEVMEYVRVAAATLFLQGMDEPDEAQDAPLH